MSGLALLCAFALGRLGDHSRNQGSPPPPPPQRSGPRKQTVFFTVALGSSAIFAASPSAAACFGRHGLARPGVGMSLQEVPALPAPLDDPFWSSLRVKPFCRGYLGSLEGQRKYESAWVGIRQVFSHKQLQPELGKPGILRSEEHAQAEWHEPTWERPRIEQGSETCLVRKDFLRSSSERDQRQATAAAAVAAAAAASVPGKGRNKKGLRAGSSSFESVRSGRPPGRDEEEEVVEGGASSAGGGVEWDLTSLWNVEQALARSDIVGMGRLRCTCRALRVPRSLLSSRRSPGGVADILPLVSVTTAYLAELPISGGQLYYGSFVLPVRASDFPTLQNWFSNAISEEELEGVCLLLCSIMPNCFEFVSGYRLAPQAVEGFHALQEVISVSRPSGFGVTTPPFKCYYTYTVLSL